MSTRTHPNPLGPKVRKDVETFLANGGEIVYVESGKSANLKFNTPRPWSQQAKDKKSKTYGSGGNKPE
jgi:hypothetical protein